MASKQKPELELAFVVPKLDKPKSIAPRSIAIMYEAQLQETFSKYPKIPNKERIGKCLGILDDINPFLGPFSTLMKTIQDEIVKSVYSNSLTSSADGEHVEKMPFFTSIARIKETKREESERTQQSLSEMQQKLKYRDHDLQILQRKNLSLKSEISDHLAAKNDFQLKINALEKSIKNSEQLKILLTRNFADNEADLKSKIETLQSSLAQANNIVEKLTVFKTVYNQDKDESLTEEERDAKKQLMVVDSTGMIEYDMLQMQKIDEQLLEILNLQIDDFDVSLQQLKKKREILSGVASYQKENEDAHASELQSITDAFKRRVSELLQERELLKRHKNGLQITYHKYKSEPQSKTVKRIGDEALRKYSFSMVMSEDGGKSFKLFSDLQYCSKCTARTIVCPHRTTTGTVFTVPKAMTHFKFTQPSLRVKTILNRGAYENLMNAKMLDEDDEDEEISDTEDEIDGVSRSFLKIWGDYYDNRGGKKPLIHRNVSIEKLKLLAREVYEAAWIYDEEACKEDPTADLPSFMDHFHRFINERYQIEEVSLKACHDIFTVLQSIEGSDDYLDMFIDHLSGKKDILWKYVHLFLELTNRYEDFDILRYRMLLQIVYPNRQNFELELVSFSKNKITRENAEEHLIHQIQSEIEPNYRFFYKSLKKFDYQKRGFMTCDDFDESLAQIMPSISRQAKKSSYKHAEATCREDAVTIDRLAQVASYLFLQTIKDNRWISMSMISREFMDIYFKDGFKDEDNSDDSDDEDIINAIAVEDDSNIMPTEIANIGVYSQNVTEESVVNEELKMIKELGGIKDDELDD